MSSRNRKSKLGQLTEMVYGYSNDKSKLERETIGVRRIISESHQRGWTETKAFANYQAASCLSGL